MRLPSPWSPPQPGSGVHLLLLTPEVCGSVPQGSVVSPPARFCGTCLRRSSWALLRFVFGNRSARAKRNSVGVFNLVS